MSIIYIRYRLKDLFLHYKLQSIIPTRMYLSTCLIFLLTVLGIIFHYLQKQQEEDDAEHKNSSSLDQQSPHKQEHDQRDGSSSSSSLDKPCRHFSIAEIKSATCDFDDALVIGKGGFGKVYKGTIDFGERTDVAIKRFNLDSNQGATEFQAEIEMLSKFRHGHIVSLLGYHEGNEKREMILVYEYMPNGSLEDHLHKRKANGSNCSLLTWIQRLHICIGAARGLDYLHTGTSVQHKVIHRDIKSSNILLDENLAAKIADFGLSRIGPANLVGTTNVYTDQIKGTFGYMDAEYFSTRRLTRKTDVYAFGVVLLEVLCGRPALDFTLDEEQHSLAVWAKDCIREGNIDRILDPCLRGQTTSNCLKEFVRIASECILTRSKNRPTMSKVVARLEFVLDLASQKHGGVTISEKVWSLFSLKIPVKGKSYKLMQKWSGYNKTKRTILDKAMEEGSSKGKDPTEPAAEGSNGNINKNVTTKDGVSDNIECHDAAIMLKVQQPSSSQMATQDLKIFTFDELRRTTRNFLPSELLGVSDGASVYKGWVDSASYEPSALGVGIAVAIKISNTNNAQSRKEWQAEVKWGKFSHPNLVKLLGYCSEGRMRLLVHGYMPNRNFVDVFHRRRVAWDRTMKIAIGVAKGLAFLHTDKRTLLFRTFNASNILLNEDDEAQLYFGWASLSRVRGSFSTTRYNPPEYMATGRWYVKSDVYAFGVTMLDMIAGLGFLDDKQGSSPQSLMERATPILSDNYTLQRMLERRLGQVDSPKGANKVADLILNCLEIAQKKRPSMKEIVATLQEINAIEII